MSEREGLITSEAPRRSGTARPPVGPMPTAWRRAGLGARRILFRLIWSVDVCFTWQPRLHGCLAACLHGGCAGPARHRSGVDRLLDERRPGEPGLLRHDLGHRRYSLGARPARRGALRSRVPRGHCFVGRDLVHRRRFRRAVPAGHRRYRASDYHFLGVRRPLPHLLRPLLRGGLLPGAPIRTLGHPRVRAARVLSPMAHASIIAE